jgi:hypothetical protein
MLENERKRKGERRLDKGGERVSGCEVYFGKFENPITGWSLN